MGLAHRGRIHPIADRLGSIGSRPGTQQEDLLRGITWRRGRPAITSRRRITCYSAPSVATGSGGSCLKSGTWQAWAIIRCTVARSSTPYGSNNLSRSSMSPSHGSRKECGTRTARDPAFWTYRFGISDRRTRGSSARSSSRPTPCPARFASFPNTKAGPRPPDLHGAPGLTIASPVRMAASVPRAPRYPTHFESTGLDHVREGAQRTVDPREWTKSAKSAPVHVQ